MNAAQFKSFAIGRHVVSLEAPSYVSVVLDGPMSVEEAESFTQIVRELALTEGGIYLLADATRFVSSGARVRKVIAEGNLFTGPVRALAVFGASFPLRITINMVVKASMHLFPGRFDFPFELVGSESQARAFLAKHRAEHEAARNRDRMLEAV